MELAKGRINCRNAKTLLYGLAAEGEIQGGDFMAVQTLPELLRVNVNRTAITGSLIIELADQLGRVIQRSAIEGNSNSVEIHTQTLSGGIYYLNLRGTGGEILQSRKVASF